MADNVRPNTTPVPPPIVESDTPPATVEEPKKSDPNDVFFREDPTVRIVEGNSEYIGEVNSATGVVRKGRLIGTREG